jgi:hypothetical protein
VEFTTAQKCKIENFLSRFSVLYKLRVAADEKCTPQQEASTLLYSYWKRTGAASVSKGSHPNAHDRNDTDKTESIAAARCFGESEVYVMVIQDLVINNKIFWKYNVKRPVRQMQMVQSSTHTNRKYNRPTVRIGQHLADNWLMVQQRDKNTASAGYRNADC